MAAPDVVADTHQPLGSSESPRPRLWLAEHDGRIEREMLEQWLAGRGVSAKDALLYEQREDQPISPGLVEALVAADVPDEVALAPVRVAWLPKQHGGQRTTQMRDLLKLADPRRPSERLKRRRRRDPDRWRVVEAEPAPLAALRQRWRSQAATQSDASENKRSFARFVARQAALSLERAEYRAQGARYKVPRVTKEDVTGSASFRDGIARLAAQLNRDEAAIWSEAEEYLDELRTAHDPFTLDLAAKLFHWMYANAYGKVDVRPDQIERLRETFAKHPVILLPSHKSNLDSPILESVLAIHDLPPPTLFGGINMAFWPMGPIFRRAGRVFMRRKISDNSVYKFVLREYMGYMIEKRFNFEWYPEGTRSRTGKLLPPKLGLYSYAADAYRLGKVDDLLCVPVSIIYDQAVEVAEYAREAHGGEKQAEGMAWMAKTLRTMHEPRGTAYLRIGEPQSMRTALGPPDAGTDGKGVEAKLALQKLAFAVAYETNRVTPITGISLVTFALLTTGERAVPLEQIQTYTDLLVGHARERGQPLTESAQLDGSGKIIAILAELIRTRVVTCYDKGPTTIYSIAKGQHLAAAFYRNSMLHFVLERAIAEMAVVGAAALPAGERERAFWRWALALRDGLKFEFFFRERPQFDGELEAELARINPDWRPVLMGSGSPLEIHRAIFGPGIAHGVLRPFVEAHKVVAQALLSEPLDAPLDERAFLDKCQNLGQQLLMMSELRNPESVSKPLFQSSIQLVRNIKLADPGSGPGSELAERRASFARRVNASIARMDAIQDGTRWSASQMPL